MSTPIELSKAAQEQILAAIKQSQEIALTGVELWATAVAPFAKAPQAPIALDLPKPADLVANSFGFAEKILASQKEFAQKVVAVTAPVVSEKPVAASKA
jgi:hypothetical protein